MKQKANFSRTPVKGKPARKRTSSLEPLEERIAPAVAAGPVSNGILTVSYGSPGDSATVTATGSGAITVAGTGFSSTGFTAVTELVIVFDSTNQSLTTVDSAALFNTFLTKSVHGPIIQSSGATTGTTILDSTGGNLFDFGGVTSAMTLTSNSNADTISATKTASYSLANGLLTSSDNLSLTLSGTAGITTANLTDTGGSNTFNVSGWTHGGTLTGLSTDTVVDTKSGGFTLSSNNLSDTHSMNLALSGIAIANLTDSSTGGAHSFTVTGWTGTGTLTNNGSASDTVVASNSGGFTLSGTSLVANGGFSLTLGTNVLTANLTDTSTSAQTFNVSGWAGTGSLTSTSTLDTVLASQPAGYTLANGSLASTNGMSLTLNGITNATLTDSAGGNNFTVSGWTHTGTFTGGSTTSDTITASKNGFSFTLSNTSLVSNDGLNVSLSHFGMANLTDTHGGESFTVSGWTGLGTLTDTTATLDTVIATKTGASFTLSNTSLVTSDNMSLALAGATQSALGFGTANLTDLSGGQSFTVSGWTGGGTLTDSVATPDTVIASKAAGYTLANLSLASTDGMSLTLSAHFNTANLTDTAGGNSFTVTGWTGTGTLTDSSYLLTADTIVASKNVSYTLTNTSLVDTGADSMSLTLGGNGGFNANLTDTGGNHSFTVSGFTGTGTLTNDGATADTLIASKQAGYTLANNLLTSTDNMSLTLAAGAPGNLTAPFGTANLTDTTGSVSFTVSGWTGKGTLTDSSVSVTADVIVASKASGFTLANNLLQSGDGMSLTLTPATGGSNLGIATADLTDTVGGNTFIVGGWTGNGTLTNSSSAPVAPDTITASKSAGYTLSNTLLSSTDNMSLTLSGDFATANLTDTHGGESFTVSQWTGTGSLINTGSTADTVIAVKNASFVLANNLVTSTDGMSFTLGGAVLPHGQTGFGTANLTDIGGGNSFTISAWTGNGTLDNASNPVVADALIINKSGTVTLGNTSVSSADGMSLILAGSPGAFGSAQIQDTTGGTTYNESNFTGSLTLTNTSGSPDTVVISASSGYVLTNSSLMATDGLSLTLSGAFGTMNLTDTTGGHSFTVSGWTGGGTFDNTSSPAIPDTIVASKNASFTLGNGSLSSSDQMSLTLLGAFGTAYLNDTGGNHSFTTGLWTGNGGLFNSSAPFVADTVSESKTASYTLSNLLLLSSDGMSLTLSGIEIASLKDTGGGQTFDVGGWTGTGTLTNSSSPLAPDTIIASKNAGFVLSNTLLTSTDTMSLNLAGVAGAFGTANLTDTTGGHSFTVSGWSGNGSLSDASSPLVADTVVAAKTSSFVLSNQSLSSGAMSLSLSSIGVANLTDTVGGLTFTVSGWTGSGALTNGGTGAADTLVASKTAGYVLTNGSLTSTDNMSLALSGSFGTANLTDSAGGNSFTVSGWTGKGTLTNSSSPLLADAIVASKSGSFTLTNSLLTSTDLMSLNLAGAAGAFGTANLTDTNGGDSFTVSGWTGAGTLTNSSIPVVPDTVIASKQAGYVLSNTLLTSTDLMSLTLAGAAGAFGTAKLTDTVGGHSFTLSGWTGKGALTNSGMGADTLIASKSASYTLSNTLLASTDHMSLTLTGTFGTANLTDTAGGNTFTVSGWTGNGILLNGGTAPETIVASEGVSYFLTNTLLTTNENTSLTLSGAFGTANLTDSSGGNTFTVSGWTGNGTLTDAQAFSAPDTVVAAKAAGYVLTNTLLTSTDKMSLSLAGGTGAFETANLTDTAGNNSFTVSGWTGGGTLTNAGSKPDALGASKNASYTLADISLVSSDGMSLTLAASAPGSLPHPFGTANLTDTGGNQTFVVSGWSSGGSLTGPSTDTVTASKAGGFVLSNALLKDTADSMSLTLSGIANANLTDISTAGENIFTVSGWTGAGTLTNNGSTGDTISASKSASYTLTNSSLASSDKMSLTLSGFTVANLTDTGGSHSFTVTGWTQGGSLTGPASDSVVASKNGGFTLTNTLLTDAYDSMSLSLNGIGLALLTDTAGSQSFTVNGWTGGGTLTNSGATPDTLVATKAGSFTLSNTSLSSSDGMSLALGGTGGFTTADLTDTAGVQSFTVSGWTGSATLTGASTDSVIAVKAGGFTLTNTTLIDTADAMNISLVGIGSADLTDTAGNDSITVSGWTGTGTLTNEGARSDTLIAAKSASFTLSNTQLRTSDGMNMALAGGTGTFDTANLTDLLVVELVKVPGGSIAQDAGGDNTFTVSGWTGGGTLENDGASADTVAATKSASFTLSDAALVSSDGMSLTLIGGGGTGGGIPIADLKDTGGNHSFTVDGWDQGGSLTGTTGDSLHVTKNANFTLTDTSIMTSDGLSMALSDIPIANLSVATATYGPTTFDASGFSGTLTATGGSPIPTAAGLAPLGNVFDGGSGHNTLIGGTDRDHYILQGLSTESDTLVEPANDAFALINGYYEIGNSIDFSNMTTPTGLVNGVKIGVNVDMNDISPAGVTQVFDPSVTDTNPKPGDPGTLTLIGSPGVFDELSGSPFKDTLIANNASRFSDPGTIATLGKLLTSVYTGGDTTAEDTIITGQGGAYVIYGQHLPFTAQTEPVPSVVFQLPTSVPYFVGPGNQNPETTVDAKHPLKYTDNFGDIITITVTGPGEAQTYFDSVTNDPDLVDLSGTTTATGLTIKVANIKGLISVGDITDGGNIGSILLGTGVSLSGEGGEASVAVADVHPSSSLVVVPQNPALNVTGSIGSLTVDGVGAGAELVAGSIGSFTSTGAIDDGSSLSVAGKLGSFTANLTKAAGNVVAVDGLAVQAASIGGISVSLTGAAGLLTNGIAIDGASFAATSGNLGPITVSVAGVTGVNSPASGSGVAIVDSSFLATGSITSITAKAAGIGYAGQSLSLTGVVSSSFAANDNIGAVLVNEIAAGKGYTPVIAGIQSTATAPSRIEAGGSIASVSVTGDVSDTDIFAGANLGGSIVSALIAHPVSVSTGGVKIPTTNAGLSTISLGAVTITGSLTSDAPGAFAITASGDLGDITIGGNMTGYALAGGFDGATGNADANGRIAEVIVKGQFSNSSIVAGVAPAAASVDTPYIWGAYADSAGASLEGVTQKSRVGPIILGALTAATNLQSDAQLAHDSAIEAYALVSIKIGKLATVSSFTTTPSYIDENGGAEAPIDTVVRIEV